ncbi:arginine N-methyltransferase 2 [Trichoderma citrinoviride]|uniref:Arginine N-methyltransferase 2 n=1 Tax=Trichoderma citrinoviride TaxID=58853 RepID=A0A2T4BD40_9HYPO|nr:arginine N-methyltransferase 2 [Trichoderma citrinoviride]PTB67250.1 arginine N-methyltransferase 2 [Trichoderma citrinoviride]
MPSPIDDSLQARISPDCPQDTRDVLHHAWAHDLSGLKKLLAADRSKASVQDPKTGETPLHAAIRACGPADELDKSAAAAAAGDKDEAAPEEEAEEEDEGEDGCVEEARDVVQALFFSGAIWNDVDANNETPGCVAYRLGRKALYNLCVDAGVRAEILFALMDGYEELSSGEDEEDDEAMKDDEVAEKEEDVAAGADEEKAFVPPEIDEKPVTSKEYLESDLTYDANKLLDADLNGVMMSWETDIMRRSVAALLPGAPLGKRVLNVGFGMGIIDGMFADLKPSRHHIIEAHPKVLEHIASPGSAFGRVWEDSGPEEGEYQVCKGRWQDVVPLLAEAGYLYDAIYFDTFGEDYSQLRTFIMEWVPALLDQGGRFSFFNGLGADRRVCYDVYTKVVEMHCADAGLDVEWEESDVDMAQLDKDGQGEWEGVRRRYWTLDKYRLPICTFMG